MAAVLADKNEIYTRLGEITDPEIPVLSITDLGIVRDIQVAENNEAIITITSTYNGCPAMDMIAAAIRMELVQMGFEKIKIIQSVSPAWTTDWMTEAGKQKMKDYGIAPPDKRFLIPADGVECPQCHSSHTKLISEFGSTACKALYQCEDCREPFDYFKCH